MATLDLAVLPGDGVGPEVVEAALEVLDALAGRFGHDVHARTWPVGWSAIEELGTPLPPETLAACRRADAILLGAVGDPRADALPALERPEAGLLRLRRALGCHANLRPVRVPDGLIPYSVLEPEAVRGTDLVIVRELSGGLYYGEPRGSEDDRAWNTLTYTAEEIRRVARTAFEIARGRRGRLVSVDKANVLEVFRLWRSVVAEVATDFPDVELAHWFVDRAAYEIVLRPAEVDTLLTSNLFGDILSDEAAALAGSLGLLGSASLGGETDLYEPVHGSAPDIAGTGTANPIGMMRSVALMLRHTFGLDREARALDEALDLTLADGARTPDLKVRGGRVDPRQRPDLGTDELATLVRVRLEGPSRG